MSDQSTGAMFVVIETPEAAAARLLNTMPRANAMNTVLAMREHLWRDMAPGHFNKSQPPLCQRLAEIADADAWIQQVYDLVSRGVV